jgi:hypothetical protein
MPDLRLATAETEVAPYHRKGATSVLYYKITVYTSQPEETFVPDIGGTSYRIALCRLMVVIAGIEGKAEVGT